VISRDLKATTEGIDRAISEFGSLAHLARALGVVPDQLRAWRSGSEQMPLELYEAMLALAAERRQQRAGPDLKRRRILVADDHRDTAETLAALLDDLGHEVRFVTDPRNVVTFTRELRPEIVLLDLAMPGLDGYECARLIRAELGAEVYLVAVTGDDRDEARIHSRQAGFDAHLLKPVDMALLLSILAHADIGRRRS
jgi:CheY-like chemotaxis protein